MQVHPTALELLPDGHLRITWSDDVVRVYTIQQLRDACPCASCLHKRTAAESRPSPIPDERPPLTLAGMEPVGNYAYSITFSDGHDTGIYTLDLLHELGEQVLAG